MINVQYEQDAAHGWLIVTATDVASVGLTAKDFSAFSYASQIDGKMVFALEEDRDASVFSTASRRKGIDWNVRETQSQWSDVRSWASIETQKPSIIDEILADFA